LSIIQEKYNECENQRFFFFRFSRTLSIDRRVLFVSIFIFGFYSRSNNSIPSPDQQQLSPRQMTMETNESIPSPPSHISNTKTNSLLNRQLNDDLNSQQGKRKFSLSQYKEHKRIKSNESIQSPLTDTDMRINTTENIKVRIKS
jgi:hypothetical protein